MEDLRDKNKKLLESNNMKGSDISTYLGHIPSLWDKIWAYKYLIFKYFIITVLVIVICLYPNEIGTLIGNWVFDFYSGITNNF